jgi:hypothetical protein
MLVFISNEGTACEGNAIVVTGTAAASSVFKCKPRIPVRVDGRDAPAWIIPDSMAGRISYIHADFNALIDYGSVIITVRKAWHDGARDTLVPVSDRRFVRALEEGFSLRRWIWGRNNRAKFHMDDNHGISARG